VGHSCLKAEVSSETPHRKVGGELAARKRHFELRIGTREKGKIFTRKGKPLL